MNLARLLIAGLGVAFSTGFAWSENALPPLPRTIGPYLQNPTTSGATVCCLVQGGGTVQVSGENGESLKAQYSQIPGTPWTIWKARLDSLKPAERCTYRVRVEENGGILAETNAEVTALDEKSASTKVIFLNDLHNNRATLEALMKQVKDEDYSLSILLGDCWGDPNPANGADTVFRTLDAYVRMLNAARKPMLLVRGNHETRGGFSGRMAMLFDIPGLDSAQKLDDQTWSFALRAGPAFLLAMDTGEDDDFATDEKSYKRPKFWQSYRQRQAPWLKSTLGSANGAQWRIFLSHIPLYNPAGWDSEPSRTCWEPLLRDAGLALMLAGHDHQWRSVPAGKEISRAKKHRDGSTSTETMKPPCPVLIGGGPSIREGTVMLLEATPARLQVRMLNVEGKVLAETSLTYPTTNRGGSE
jgi:acid phosphatase type 7